MLKNADTIIYWIFVSIAILFIVIGVVLALYVLTRPDGPGIALLILVIFSCAASVAFILGRIIRFILSGE